MPKTIRVAYYAGPTIRASQRAPKRPDTELRIPKAPRIPRECRAKVERYIETMMPVA